MYPSVRDFFLAIQNIFFHQHHFLCRIQNFSFENPVYFDLLSLEITDIFGLDTIGSLDLENVENHTHLELSDKFKNPAFQIKYFVLSPGSKKGENYLQV